MYKIQKPKMNTSSWMLFVKRYLFSFERLSLSDCSLKTENYIKYNMFFLLKS